MHPGSREPQPGSKELAVRIRESLLTVLRTLNSVNSDIYDYHHYHLVKEISPDPSEWKKLEEVYASFEDQANHCRRLWLTLRSATGGRASPTKGASHSSASGSRPRERSPSPLEYQSDPDEGRPAGTGRGDQVTPMEVDPVEVERDIPRPETPPVAPPPPRRKPKGVMITPSGPTSCRLAPIPKGVKLSVETTRIPVPQKPFTFDLPKKFDISDSERKPLNRTKYNKPAAGSPQNTPSSSGQSSSWEAKPSTAQTSVQSSPKRDYSSAREYWEPRRAIRTHDFQMDEDRRFASLDCLESPFPVRMQDITHNTIPAKPSDLNSIYGGKMSFTPKPSAEKLASHGFDHWMIPNMEFHPFLPPQPGWPGLMLRLDDELEEWQPEGGKAFRVVIKKEPNLLEYVGQYEMVRLSDIAEDEWKKQPAKVKNKWTRILGGGQSWHDAIVRISLRKNLGKEPSIQEFTKYADTLAPDDYTSLARDLKVDIDRAFREGEEVIAVWGMKCVGYDYKFEKHLAHSLKTMKPSPSKKRKAATRDNNAMSEDEDEKGEEPESDDPSPSKRQRLAKGKAKLVRYDWSDARPQGDSDDDYQPV